MSDWRYEVVVADDRTELSDAAAEYVAAAAQTAIAERGAFAIALSGGSTPRDLFALLASPRWRAQLDWASVQVFWGDERCVPPDDERSNYRMAREKLLDQVPLPVANVHRPRAEADDREAAAAEYAATVRRVVPPDADGVPRFDLILLGLGDDGHTASLLPGSVLVGETERLVAVTDVQREGTTRLTFTPPLLNHAASLLFLAAGADKAAPLREVLRGELQPERYPAQVVREARGEVVFLIDRAAAAEIDQAEPDVTVLPSREALEAVAEEE